MLAWCIDFKPFEFAEGLERYNGLCVEKNIKINWKNLMAYKKKVLDPFPEILTGMFKNWGFTFIREKGKILDAHTV